jgi:hypothetical protein
MPAKDLLPQNECLGIRILDYADLNDSSEIANAYFNEVVFPATTFSILAILSAHPNLSLNIALLIRDK